MSRENTRDLDKLLAQFGLGKEEQERILRDAESTSTRTKGVSARANKKVAPKTNTVPSITQNIQGGVKGKLGGKPEWGYGRIVNEIPTFKSGDKRPAFQEVVTVVREGSNIGQQYTFMGGSWQPLGGAIDMTNKNVTKAPKPPTSIKKASASGSKTLDQASSLNQKNKPKDKAGSNKKGTKDFVFGDTRERSVREIEESRARDRERYHKKRAPNRYKPGTVYDPNKHRLMKSKQFVDDDGRIRNIRRYRVGEQYRASKGKPLTGGLYVKPDGTIGRTSIARAERSRALMEHKREQKKLSKAKMREIRLEAQRARDRIGKNVTRKKQRAVAKKIRDKDFMTRLRKAEGFRKQPVHFTMRRQLDGARLRPGQKQLIDSLPHSVRHPPVRHASRRPMTPPVPMDGLNGRMTLVSRHWTGRGERVPGVPGQFAATPDTLKTSKFPEGGYGIYFRLNTTNVVNALSRHYPEQMVAASKRFAPMIGKKLLDIIEPYVPKDTGLMYTTATEVSGRDISDSFRGVGSIGDSSFGVAISYNTPYAEMVYYDKTKAHGREYNLKHGTNVKGELETARWIEAAFSSPAEKVRIRGLMEEYASKVVGALKSVRLKPSK